MASVFKRPGSKYYYFRLYQDGGERWVNTWKTTRKEAAEIAEAQKAAAKGRMTLTEIFGYFIKQLLTLPADDQCRIRKEFGRALLHDTTAALPLAETWQAWIDSPMTGDPTPGTVAGYKGYWTRFEAWATKRGIDALHEVTASHAQDYAGDLWGAGLSPRTYNGALKFLRSAFKALRVKAGLVDNPWQDIPPKPNETQSRESFTAEEIVTICTKATGATRCMIGLGLYTGLRLGDVVSLEWESVKPDRIELVPGKTRRKGKRLALPIHPVLARLLAERRAAVPQGERYVFPDEHAQHVRNRAEVSKRFQDFLKGCGIVTNSPAAGHRRLCVSRKSFHSLRHSFVSLCAANAVPQHVIQALVGHGSPAMTEHYTHVDEGQKRLSIAALPAVGFGETKGTP